LNLKTLVERLTPLGDQVYMFAKSVGKMTVVKQLTVSKFAPDSLVGSCKKSW